MKKISLFVVLACLFAACNVAPKIEKEAKEQCNQLFTELAKDPSSVKLSDLRTVYMTDSMCIMHLTFSAKNGLGVETSDNVEYVYFKEGEKAYQTYIDLDDNDSIYLNEEELNKVKKYTFYADLDYANAMKHRVISVLNERGRVVGNSDAAVELKPLVNTGKWELKYYKDEFGEYSNDKYLVLSGSGVFSNSATTNSDMSAILFVDDESISMRLIEYRSSVVKDDDSFKMKVKDGEGVITEFHLYNSKSGYMSFYNSSYFGNNYDNMLKILNKEGIARCSGVMYSSYSSSSYTFAFDMTGFKEAVEFLKK